MSGTVTLGIICNEKIEFEFVFLVDGFVHG